MLDKGHIYGMYNTFDSEMTWSAEVKLKEFTPLSSSGDMQMISAIKFSVKLDLAS